ncbi:MULTISPECIES: tripartite tricarboxylate transporter substrate binding protein [unclassified Cupriavidus]|uniref:Bug family tripartite tricarboxylate transporter substrate binding protein n=1 Tax=unclassified Cupriavidus TaxID=2640874 RepID=UPI001AE4CC47|nr:MULTISPECIES: tripartite tricarboxylate transporter substrate binding protein [unclassified Cupriavidus]MBP0628761.1 tripartite tricarboxylate transporter substrate binding protein [Cupriavidus sp. AcVe19-1a]MBP0634459.1 tripartite tricarboxylate transporter substrate binding protein [Cupriavidus sp. AcVe19-6a]
MTAMPPKLFLACAAFSAAMATAPAMAQAPAWPERPLRLVVPFAAGGATDLLGRLLAVGLGEKLGQPVVVENKPGASTVVGANQVAKAAPDGYTLLLAASTTLTLNPAIRQHLGYDPIKSFTPLGLVADMSLVLVANPDAQVNSLKDLVTQAKAHPDKFSYGSFGTGSSVHFGGEMLKSATGIRMVHVPFNGSAPSLTALTGGQVQVAVDTVVASLPLIKGGKIWPVAVLSPQRLPALPQVPTVAESGYPGFQMGTWFALLAPAGLPAPVQQKLEKALAEVANAPATRARMVELALTPAYGNGAAVRARVEKELPEMRAVAARADIRAE